MPKRYSLYILIFLLGIALYIWSRVIYAAPETNGIKVIFMDVGQGDAALVLMPAGKQMLIDGGPDDSVLQGLGKFMPPFDNEIEYVVLTHPHADHLTGLNKVLQKYKVDRVYEGQGTLTSATFGRWKEELKKQRIADAIVSPNQEIKLSDDINFTVLSAGQSENPNNTSVVGRLKYQNTAFMLMGDAEIEVQSSLCNLPPEKLRSDVLKVAHHGSNNGTLECFMKKVAPYYAVISVGRDNKYGHPHAGAITIISRFAREILRTDQRGSVVCKSDGNKVGCE